MPSACWALSRTTLQPAAAGKCTTCCCIAEEASCHFTGHSHSLGHKNTLHNNTTSYCACYLIAFWGTVFLVWLAAVHVCVQLAVARSLPKPKRRRRWLKLWKSWSFTCLLTRDTITSRPRWTPWSTHFAVWNRWKVCTVWKHHSEFLLFLWFVPPS